jgi:flagellar biosynthetic protein FlhB
MAEKDGRTEKATGKRRQEARRRGQVARSSDVNSVVGLVAVFAVLVLGASRLLGELTNLLQHSLGHLSDGGDLSTTGVQSVALSSIRSFLLIILPIAGVAAVAGITANVAQVRFKWSSEALRPRFSMLNPKNGLKRIFGLNGLVETGKTVAKLGSIGGFAFIAVWSQIPQLGSLVGIAPSDMLGQIGTRIERVTVEVVAVLLVVAALDVVWQRRKLEKALMMTKEEVKQEARQTDIAPEVRGAIRRRQLQAARRRMLADVPGADVVIVNPTHFAVALRYDPAQPAPQVVAKGADHVAAAIRAAAEEHGVPLVSNPPLARTLYRQVDIGQMIPEALYVAVAEVLAYVFRTARRRRPALRPAVARAGA